MKVGDPITYVLRQRQINGDIKLVVRVGVVQKMRGDVVALGSGTSTHVFAGDWTGIRWIYGCHVEDSPAVKALLVAFALAQPPGLGAGTPNIR